MSNVFLKITVELLPKRQFSGFKKFVFSSVFGGVPIHTKTSCCNLKIRGMRAKLCVAFLLF